MALPPTVKTHPVLQLARWIRDPFATLERARAKYGDTFTMRLPGRVGRVVVMADPEMVKQLFALPADDAHAGKGNVVLKPFLGARSLLVLDGAEHARQRKMMTPPFHGDRMHEYGRTMLDVANASIDDWPVGEPFPAHRPMQSIALQVILRTVFGVVAGSARFRDLEATLARSLDAAAPPLLLFPFMQRDLGRYSAWGRFRYWSEKASASIRAEIARVRAGGSTGRDDVLSMLAEARDEAGRPLDDDELHDELVTLLVAGHETSATALAWTLRWLLPNAALVSRLRDEVAGARGDPGRIAKLELLDATVRESLRLQPVVPLVGRVLQRPARIGDYDLAAGTAVAASIVLVHRNASLYPDPHAFHPDRFLSFKPSPWQWLPFGGGVRRCLGAAFALQEMKIVLAAVVDRVDARLAAGPNAVVRGMRRSITVSPRGGLPIVVTDKRPRSS